MPYVTRGHEGFDINNPEDIILLEYLAQNNFDLLEHINLKPFKK